MGGSCGRFPPALAAMMCGSLTRPADACARSWICRAPRAGSPWIRATGSRTCRAWRTPSGNRRGRICRVPHVTTSWSTAGRLPTGEPRPGDPGSCAARSSDRSGLPGRHPRAVQALGRRRWRSLRHPSVCRHVADGRGRRGQPAHAPHWSARSRSAAAQPGTMPVALALAPSGKRLLLPSPRAGRTPHRSAGTPAPDSRSA